MIRFRIRLQKNNPKTKLVILTIITGNKMIDGFLEPAIARSPKMVVGRSCTEQVLNRRNRHISLLGFSFFLFSWSSFFMASNPEGVAALPIPSILEEMFKEI